MIKEMNNAYVMITKEAHQLVLSALYKFAQMHMELMDLYELEDHLKKRHQAYLHVREHAVRICTKHKKEMIQTLEELFDHLEPGGESDCDAQSKESRQNCLLFEVDPDEEVPEASFPTEGVVIDRDTFEEMKTDMETMVTRTDQLARLIAALLSGRKITRLEMARLSMEANDDCIRIKDRWTTL